MTMQTEFKRERQEAAKEMQGFAQAVAAALALLVPGWTYQPPEPDRDGNREGAAVIDGPLPMQALHLHRWMNSDRERVTVSGCWPRDAFGEMYAPYRDRPSIGVSITRESAAVARDIVRRLLPDYLEQWARQLEHARANDERRRVENAAVQNLAALLPEEGRRVTQHQPGRSDKPGVSYQAQAGDRVQVGVCAEYADRTLSRVAVDLDIRTDEATATRVLQFLAETCPPPEPPEYGHCPECGGVLLISVDPDTGAQDLECEKCGRIFPFNPSKEGATNDGAVADAAS